MVRKIIPLLVVVLLSFVNRDANAQVKKIYIANDDHTDYMWTLDEAGYKTAFLAMLDSWTAKNTTTYGNGTNNPDYTSKWNTDGSFWIWTYERNRSATQFDTLIAQIRRGQITVPYSPLIVTYGSMPAEAVLRGMYYAGDLERRKNLKFKMATSMENQTTPLGVASLWKGAGAKYCWQGVCNCFTQVTGLSGRAKEIYWAKGLDTNKVLMKWYSYLTPPFGGGTGSHIGGYSEARYVNNTITDLLNKCGTGPYPFNIAGGFGVGYDDAQTLANDNLRDAAVANTNINQRIVVSNETDFFEDFEATHGSTLDSLSVTYGNEWDMAVASLAEVSAKVKRSLEKLRAAEAMAAVVINYEPTFTAQLDSMRKEAWMSMGLYYEHNFGFEQGTNTFIQRNAFQRRQQKSIADYVDSLYNLSKAKLGYYITQGLGANTRFFAFNPLGWKRTDYADYKYSVSMAGKRVIEVLSGNEVPYQTVTKDGNQYIRILADSIPSVGYKIYEIQNTAPASFPNTDPAATTTTINNGVYRVTCTKEGVITSLIDLANSKELVTGGTKFINDLGAGISTDPLSSATVESNGPISVTIRCDANLPIKHTTRITLYKNVARVDIDNQITQAMGGTRTWAYSFNIASPTVWHEETGAVIKAKLKANGGHYSAQNARYDWSTLHHFASVNDAAGYGVSLSNQDCYFMKLGNSSVGSLNQSTADLNILAGGQIDGATGNPLGIPSQGGDVLFNQRFAITTHNNYSAANDMKKALEHQDSMVCGTVSTLVNFLPETQYSYMSNNDPSSLIWSIKPSEEGWLGGAITRIWNLSDNDASATVNFDLVIDAAARTSHVETDMEELSIAPGTRNFTVGLGHNEMKTFRTKLIIIPLVARVLSFTGNKVAAGNELKWNASGETELKEYILERNAGNGFIAIATIKAARGNGENRYVYNDKNINDQTTYQYRLKLIATNGKFNYSSIVLIRSGNETGSMLVFPNPVSSPVNIHLVLDKKTRCDVTVYNAAGAVVKKPSPPLFEKGNNYYTIPIDELAPGHYTIVVNAGDKKFTESFVKW